MMMESSNFLEKKQRREGALGLTSKSMTASTVPANEDVEGVLYDKDGKPFSANLMKKYSRGANERTSLPSKEIEKAYEVLTSPIDLMKGGGEGSRGGKIIGHTKSGHPIYEDSKHNSHTHFTSADHSDAAQLHHKISMDKKWGDDFEKQPSSKRQKLLDESKMHFESAVHHSREGGIKQVHETTNAEWEKKYTDLKTKHEGEIASIGKKLTEYRQKGTDLYNAKVGARTPEEKVKFANALKEHNLHPEFRELAQRENTLRQRHVGEKEDFHKERMTRDRLYADLENNSTRGYGEGRYMGD